MAAWFSPIAAFAQQPAGSPIRVVQDKDAAVVEELKALRQLVEMQSKQIDTLTAQITRLGAELERRNKVSPESALPPATPTPAADPAPGESEPPAPAPPVVTAAGKVHIIVKGDSLDKIAKQYGTTSVELQKLNKITDPKKLQIGQQILLPAAPTNTKPQ